MANQCNQTRQVLSCPKWWRDDRPKERLTDQYPPGKPAATMGSMSPLSRQRISRAWTHKRAALRGWVAQHPLLAVKQTSRERFVMSAFDPKQTFRPTAAPVTGVTQIALAVMARPSRKRSSEPAIRPSPKRRITVPMLVAWPEASAPWAT